MHTVGLPRTCLGFTNILFFLFGLIGCIICVWCAINTEFFQDVNYTVTKSSLVDAIARSVNLKLWFTPLTSFLIPLTVLTMVTSCCGILGSGCKFKCAIKSYIFLITVLSSVAFWVIFISGIYNIYTRNEKTRSYLLSTLQTYYGRDNDVITSIWNYVMVNNECCGVNGYRDFASSQWQKMNTDKLFPVQCCQLVNKTVLLPVSKDCSLNDDPEVKSYKDVGCFYALRQFIIGSKGKIIFFIILLIILYTILMLFAYCIIRGEPLLQALTERSILLPSKNWEISQQTSASPSAPDENMYLEEPPKKIVRVVSAVNPFQTYKFTPNAYSSDNAYPQCVRTQI
ncbi:tetraspanin-1-like [Galleria mellonella]|uniref:Tetraspanin-1-like n=1 Tax=Galleria mellonella TaxID=7137 RepID=A0A6J3C1D0_GALME|nr:tetraspanin-1-like [Galleria mellonella]